MNAFNPRNHGEAAVRDSGARPIWRMAVGLLVSGPAALAADATEMVSLDSIIRMTFQNNLNIAIERFDLEGAELSYERFIRSRSSFTPFILDTSISQSEEREWQNGVRTRERRYTGGVSVGMEKEFFDGTNIGVEAGVTGNDNPGGQTASPYVEMGMRMPLIGSITRLERTIDRTFEETELFRAWLSFISGARNTIAGSLRTYVFLQRNLERQRLNEIELEELRALLGNPALADRPNDRAQIESEILDLQSDQAGLEGQLENNRLNLLDNIGLDALPMEQVARLEVSPDNLYGEEYLTRPIQDVIDEAFANDIEIQVLEIRRSNEELELDLALRGKWDISGRLSGSYDFKRRGDDPREPSGYRVGLGISVQRNDPRLLDLSVRQSRADIGQLDAQIEDRNRELTSEIRQNLNNASSSRRVIQDLAVSVQSRRALYDQEIAEFLAGEDSVENLLQAHNQYHQAESELVGEIFDFYQTALELDEASGRFFVELEDLLPEFNGAEEDEAGVFGS